MAPSPPVLACSDGCMQPVGSVLTLWEQGHIVDRGRGKTGETQLLTHHGVVNPVTLHTVVPATKPERPTRCAVRWAAPPPRRTLGLASRGRLHATNAQKPAARRRGMQAIKPSSKHCRRERAALLPCTLRLHRQRVLMVTHTQAGSH